MPRVGDLAAQEAQRLQDEHVAAAIANPEDEVDQVDPMHAEVRRNIFSKLEYRWRTSDVKILDQIRMAAELMFSELFDESIQAIDNFYGSLRVARINEEGLVERDAQGRVLWQKDSRGREIEDWGRLTGQDIETCLFDLAKIRLLLAPQLNELLLEAIFAKHVADDAFSDAFKKPLDDTIPARNAYASSESRQDKYFAYFRYYLYSHADAFMKEINNFCRILERTRYWRIEDQDRK